MRRGRCGPFPLQTLKGYTMRKFAATLCAALAFAAAPAQASDLSEVCRHMADAAVAVAGYGKLGGSWEAIQLTLDKSEVPTKTKAALNEVYSEAFYVWSDFPKSSVRTLAYTKCKTLLSK